VAVVRFMRLLLVILGASARGVVMSGARRYCASAAPVLPERCSKWTPASVHGDRGCPVVGRARNCVSCPGGERGPGPVAQRDRRARATRACGLPAIRPNSGAVRMGEACKTGAERERRAGRSAQDADAYATLERAAVTGPSSVWAEAVDPPEQIERRRRDAEQADHARVAELATSLGTRPHRPCCSRRARSGWACWLAE